MPELSTAEKDFLRRKHEQTSKLRAEYLKQISNPYKHATGEGGTVVNIHTKSLRAVMSSTAWIYLLSDLS